MTIEEIRRLLVRHPFEPFTIHLAKREDASNYLSETTELARRMMTKLWPGPVAIQFAVPEARRKEVATKLNLSQSEIYHDGGITLRCPDHMITSDVIAGVGFDQIG